MILKLQDLKKQKKRAPIPCVAAASCVVLRPSRGSAKDSRPSLSPGVTVSRLMMFTCDGPAALFAPCANAAFCYLPDPHESRLDSGDAFDAEVAAFDCIAEPPTGRWERNKKDVIHIRSDASVDRGVSRCIQRFLVYTGALKLVYMVESRDYVGMWVDATMMNLNRYLYQGMLQCCNICLKSSISISLSEYAYLNLI